MRTRGDSVSEARRRAARARWNNARMKYRKGDETEKARVLGISRMQLWRYRQYMDRFRKGAPTEHGASGRKPNSDMWKAIQALDNQFDKKNRDARKREAKLKAGGDRAQESRRR